MVTKNPMPRIAEEPGPRPGSSLARSELRTERRVRVGLGHDDLAGLETERIARDGDEHVDRAHREAGVTRTVGAVAGERGAVVAELLVQDHESHSWDLDPRVRCRLDRDHLSRHRYAEQLGVSVV